MRLEGFSNYEIYPETGQVWSYKSNRFIGSPNKRGYITCCIVGDNGEKIDGMMHRLIWFAVNGEIPEGMQVNHINEIKNDNRISNLNLMTNEENRYWGTGLERHHSQMVNNKKLSKPILALKNGKVILYFPSTQEATRKGFNNGSISKCLNYVRKQHKGYEWQYQDNYLADWWEQEMEKALN